MQLIQFILAVLPLATATPVALPSDETLSSLAPRQVGLVNIDVTADFNSAAVLSYIDGSLPKGTSRQGPVQVFWQQYSSLSSIVKGRTTQAHSNSDPAVRVAIKLHVNTPSWCAAVTGHIVYYFFPALNTNQNGFDFAATFDGWDTLTDNTSACQSSVNDNLRKFLPGTIPQVQALANGFLARLPQQHYLYKGMNPDIPTDQGDINILLSPTTPINV